MWLWLPIFYLALMGMLRANSILTTFNVISVLCLLAFVVYFYQGRSLTNLGMVAAITVPGRIALQSVPSGSGAAGIVRQRVSALLRYSESTGAVVRGSFLALPILLVFLVLLASADLIFKDLVGDAFRLLSIRQVLRSGWHLALSLGTAWLVAGALVIAMRKPAENEGHGYLARLVADLPRTVNIGFIETATILVLVNTLFATFVIVQFSYLFGGLQNIQIDGFTYAEYARRGFFELVAVVTLTLALILCLNHFTARETKRQLKAFNLLSSLMVAFVLVMLFSAWKRMGLYETAYGYTELRLYVYAFIAFMGVVLAWFLVTLWRKPHFFTAGVFVAAIGLLVCLNAINPDAFIVQQNLLRYVNTSNLDPLYLTQLSDDAVPGLIQALVLTRGDETRQPTCSSAFDARVIMEGTCTDTSYNIVLSDLQDRLAKRQIDSRWRRWPSYHVSRWRAFRLLEAQFPTLDVSK